MPMQYGNPKPFRILDQKFLRLGYRRWDFETYFADQIKIQHPEDHKYAGDRRGIHDQSMYNNLFGVARARFRFNDL